MCSISACPTYCLACIDSSDGTSCTSCQAAYYLNVNGGCSGKEATVKGHKFETLIPQKQLLQLYIKYNINHCDLSLSILKKYVWCYAPYLL